MGSNLSAGAGLMAAVLLATGCNSPARRIRPVIHASEDDKHQAMKSAPVIVIAEVLDYELVSGFRQVERPRSDLVPVAYKIPLRLARISANVLLPLRGNSSGRIQFYSWVWASGMHGGAHVMEDWMTPLNSRIEQIGGVIFRRTRTQVKDTQRNLDAVAHRAEMEQLKAERAKARSDRLARIDARIDAVRKKLEDALERDRRKMLFRQNQRDARIQTLQAKADQSQGEILRRLEARIAEVRRDYEERAAGSS